VLSPAGAVHVEPNSDDRPDLHTSFYVREAMPAGRGFECLTPAAVASIIPPTVPAEPQDPIQSLRSLAWISTEQN